MEWINEYTVETIGNKKIIRGGFTASAGEFVIEGRGDGGNSDTYQVTLSNGQYEMDYGKPLTFTITGAWEIREVIEMFGLLGKIMNRK